MITFHKMADTQFTMLSLQLDNNHWLWQIRGPRESTASSVRDPEIKLITYNWKIFGKRSSSTDVWQLQNPKQIRGLYRWHGNWSKKLEAAQPDCSIGWSFARIISHFFGWFACSSSFDPADRMGGCSTSLLKFSCMLQFSSVYLFWMGLQCQMHPALSFIIFITPTCCKGALWLVQDNEWEIREEPAKYSHFKDVWNIHRKLSHDHLVCCY